MPCHMGHMGPRLFTGRETGGGVGKAFIVVFVGTNGPGIVRGLNRFSIG